MIIGNLHMQAVALDSNLHRNPKIHQPQRDWSVAAELSAVVVAGAEFGDVCRVYPILFVRAGTDPQAKPQVRRSPRWAWRRAKTCSCKARQGAGCTSRRC